MSPEQARKDEQEAIGRVEDAINTYSRPSDLKITDMRIAVVRLEL
jgi:hemerythrin superfamily protein